jgi:transposase
VESEELWMELHVLHQHGWSVSALARHFKLNRRTVRWELDAGRPRGYPQRAPRHPFNAAQLAHIERRLLVCPVIRATDLHHELRTEYGYLGSYWTFLRQVRPLRPVTPREPEVRFETLPGVQTQADWKHIGRWPLGEELVELHAMVAILGHSRMPAIRIAASCTREVSFERLVRCLDDLGGVTRELLTDRDTVFCNHAAAGPLFVPEWVDLCELLGAVPRACRPYRAKTKGARRVVISPVRTLCTPSRAGKRSKSALVEIEWGCTSDGGAEGMRSPIETLGKRKQTPLVL